MELNENENKIIDLFLQEYIKEKINYMYDNKITDFKYLLKFKNNIKKIPFNICYNLVNVFQNLNNNDLSYTLLYNSILYAKKMKKIDFINYIKNENNIFIHMK